MTDHQKLGVVLFDELAIKERLIYNVKRDKIDRFACKLNGETEYIANTASVFMVKGLVDK